jgi:antitoxin MazE
VSYSEKPMNRRFRLLPLAGKLGRPEGRPHLTCAALIDTIPIRNYNVIMKVSVVQIGNSRGVRIPKAVLEQVGLRDEAEMEVRGSELIIRSANHPRAGWVAAFAKMAARGHDALLDTPTSTKWDETEWRW